MRATTTSTSLGLSSSDGKSRFKDRDSRRVPGPAPEILKGLRRSRDNFTLSTMIPVEMKGLFLYLKHLERVHDTWVVTVCYGPWVSQRKGVPQIYLTFVYEQLLSTPSYTRLQGKAITSQPWLPVKDTFFVRRSSYPLGMSIGLDESRRGSPGFWRFEALVHEDYLRLKRYRVRSDRPSPPQGPVFRGWSVD